MTHPTASNLSQRLYSGGPAAIAVLLLVLVGRAASAGAAVAQKVDYNFQIRPILAAKCFLCHGPDAKSRQADLRLDQPEAATGELPSGSVAIVPHDLEQSELVRRIEAEDSSEIMPPPEAKRPLTSREKELLKAWVAQGAPYAPHWAFLPPKRVEPPAESGSWPRNGIDNFILQRLEQENIKPAPEADRMTLIRRLSLDLLGLLPTVDQVEAFVNDRRDDAYERLVERLLASPHYGERWGRHWLDQARYADSHGYTIDSPRSIWPYRDWVIDALNRDMPFDQFTIEQLAGDLLPHATRDQQVATGFQRNSLINEEGGSDPEQFRVEAVIDRVSTAGQVWLGLTVGCAQCHDHKYDPLTQREFYELFAFFNNTEDVNEFVQVAMQLPSDAQREQIKQLESQIGAAQQKLDAYDKQQARATKSPEAAFTAAEDAERLKLLKQLRALEAQKQKVQGKIPSTLVMRELPQPRLTQVHLRGDFLRKGPVVEPNVPAWLPRLAAGSRPTRLDFGRWLVDPKNPLTARVTVNRIWLRYFGRGLVETENDFGTQGTPPTHPELLDWLAAQLAGSHWSLKHVHRLIVNSATYRQSSHYRGDLEQIDAQNKLLARQSRLRVEAEIIRDIGLSASGLLNAKIGGPSVYPPQPAGVFTFTQSNRPWQVSRGDQRYRRGMYTFFFRSSPYPMLATFDVPNFNTTCTARLRSNTPLQSLTLANDETALDFARALAMSVLRAPGGDGDRLSVAFRRCLARAPAQSELTRLHQLLDRQRRAFADDAKAARQAGPTERPAAVNEPEAAAWTAVARVLMNLDEFITRE